MRKVANFAKLYFLHITSGGFKGWGGGGACGGILLKTLLVLTLFKTLILII